MNLWASGLQFDWTISLGNVIAGLIFIMAALFAWRDLTWRVGNLELWRKEHQIDSDARDLLMQNSDKMLSQLKFLVEDKQRWMRGEERRHK